MKFCFHVNHFRYPKEEVQKKGNWGNPRICLGNAREPYKGNDREDSEYLFKNPVTLCIAEACCKRLTHESRWFEEMFDSVAWLNNMGHQTVPGVEIHTSYIYCYIKLCMLPILGFLYYQGHL